MGVFMKRYTKAERQDPGKGVMPCVLHFLNRPLFSPRYLRPAFLPVRPVMLAILP
jgi:hypothetical protein